MSEKKEKGYKFIATLASPHESSLDEKSMEIIKQKVMESAPVFLSTYFCERSKNKLLLPWDGIEAWAVTECEGTKAVVLVHNALMLDIVFKNHVLDYGPCEFKKGRIWIMPKAVTDLLNSERIVCRGVGNYVEMFTEEEYEIINDRESTALDFLKNIGF